MKLGNYVPATVMALLAVFSGNWVTAKLAASPNGIRISQEAGFTRVVLEASSAPTLSVVKTEPHNLTLTLHNWQQKSVFASPDTNELISWRFEPSPEANEGTLHLATSFVLTPQRGYQTFNLPATPDQAPRLVIDLGPNLSTQDSTSTPSTIASLETNKSTAPSGILATKPAQTPATVVTLSSAPKPSLGLAVRQPVRPAPTVVIDPGHGGIDSGMVGYVTEERVTLSVGLKLRALLQAAGIKVVMTRSSDWAFQGNKGCNKACDLKTRSGFASADRNLFVSIHVNSGGGQGIETFVFGEPLEPRVLAQAERENGGGSIGKALTAELRQAARALINDQLVQDNLNYSRQLARAVQNNLVKQTGGRNRGVENNFLGVLRYARIPAVLTEIGYGDHPVEGKNLASSSYQNKVAKGLERGIRTFLRW